MHHMIIDTGESLQHTHTNTSRSSLQHKNHIVTLFFFPSTDLSGANAKSKQKWPNQSCRKPLEKDTAGPDSDTSRSNVNNKNPNSSANTAEPLCPNLTSAFSPPRSRDSRVACRKDNLSKNISHFTAPSHFGQQASIGMFLVPLKQFANSGEDGGEQADVPPTNAASFSARSAATKRK